MKLIFAMVFTLMLTACGGGGEESFQTQTMPERAIHTNVSAQGERIL